MSADNGKSVEYEQGSLSLPGAKVLSIFAVPRMLAMLTEMKLVPHKHFGMPGDLQKHTLVYSVVLPMAPLGG